ncbi:ABC transporter permease [Glycomyces buryatensis]|uniref:ABC transporter permease n=1 Tax=Glycomyces buryatensis TaxID=2570927 RepID=A0A4S8Q5L9_9ACTN|nr:ABC-2 family transporter protein [Glycomyces buryatensis]THV38531.1 hypothetical protein FAB82_18990 [Glycomyces buryatensis]
MEAEFDMRHALAVYGRSLGANYRSMLEYQADFWIMATTGSIWTIIQFGFISILFANVNAIGGWNYHEMLVLAAFLKVAAASNALVWDGMWGLSGLVIDGGLDYRITRPAPVALQIGSSRVGMQAFGEVGLGLAMFAFGWIGAGLSPALIPIAVLLFASAIVFQIAMLTCSNAANFWIKGRHPMLAFLLLDMQSEVLRFPLTVYPAVVRMLLTFGLPLAFASFIPVQILTGRLPWWWLIGPPLAAAAAVALAVLVFRAGLRAYDSAGH